MNSVLAHHYLTELRSNCSKPVQPLQSPWLHVFAAHTKAKLRLYCFPYAGGNASIFSEWSEALGNEVEVCAIALPGRWRRVHEPSVACINALSWEIADAIVVDTRLPFAFFGHSMGAILSFEVARQLRQRGAMLPEHFFVSGAQAPHTLNETDAHKRKKVADMDEGEFLNYLQILSGTPGELLQNQEMREHIFKLMRPDLQAIDAWRYQPAKPFKQNISVFVGTEDPVIDLAAARAWQQHTLNHCQLNTIVGDHFFIHSQSTLLTHKIKRILEVEALI